MIYLRRAYLPDGSATLGVMELQGRAFRTLENPWRENVVGKSCIPEGIYTMALRESPVVNQASGNEYSDGWEIENVPGRTLIMLHPGNWKKDTQGCILPGIGFGWHQNYGPMVTSSRTAFRVLMEILSARQSWEINIICNTVTWP